MRQPWIICCLFLLMHLAAALRADSQTNASVPQSAAPYSLRVSVDEVSLSFHAVDVHGLPVNDLKLDELNLLDNGKPPRKVVAFGSLRDFPIRGGILMDTSVSVAAYLPRNRAIAGEYVQRLLRQKADEAFVMDFDFESRIAQPWTSDRNALIAGMRRVTPDGVSRLGGTAIIDSIYRACLNQFGRLNYVPNAVPNAAGSAAGAAASSANFILLFSDGEDNASHAYLNEAVEMCQRTNTSIYAFRVHSESGASDGPKTLMQLASQTGGRVFKNEGSDEAIYDDLRTIEADLRDQYRLVYQPAELKHDGSFHHIALKAPERVESIVVRAGYYAPLH
jgi:Ca-activated chloride channel family protein